MGTLAGDALLHLLPHALLAGVAGHHAHAGGGGGDDDLHKMHNEVVWKGFVVIVALIAFFFCEKMINAVGEWNRNRNRIKASLVYNVLPRYVFSLGSWAMILTDIYNMFQERATLPPLQGVTECFVLINLVGGTKSLRIINFA